jgi:formylglycine-generating enzyme required for sulfatase activity
VNDADNTRWVYAGGAFVKDKSEQLNSEPENTGYVDRFEMLTIPAGSFNMGANSGNSDESPVHTVYIARPFAMGKTEVTQAQWKEIMGNNPSQFIHCGDNCPITKVSWDDVQVFIQKLNALTRKNYRLPSEAEWAYACRGGKIQNYCGSDKANSVAWFMDNSSNSIHPVASKSANAYGLYDMSGNALEWVEDNYHNSYTGAPTNGSVWRSNAPQRVLRGGSWYSIPQGLLTTRREVSDPGNRYERFGFRLARSLP